MIEGATGDGQVPASGNLPGTRTLHAKGRPFADRTPDEDTSKAAWVHFPGRMLLFGDGQFHADRL